ncbi:MAG: HTH-type transcriptional regulator ImmR [Candidatus Izimaplasma bacterium HR2]|nr:MAG: HTH-type transcriptional regulator ImmR [Candidatus Izimaplasma bacterium HR2]
MDIKERLIEFRKMYNLTQRQIAKKLGITHSGYSKYERGLREPGLEVLVKLAELYKIPIQTFFMSTDKKFKYENLFMSELGTLYDRKYKELLNLQDYLYFNKVENAPGFAYKPKNQIDSVEINRLKKTYEQLLTELDMLSKEITKSIDRDKKSFIE